MGIAVGTQHDEFIELDMEVIEIKERYRYLSHIDKIGSGRERIGLLTELAKKLVKTWDETGDWSYQGWVFPNGLRDMQYYGLVMVVWMCPLRQDKWKNLVGDVNKMMGVGCEVGK